MNYIKKFNRNILESGIDFNSYVLSIDYDSIYFDDGIKLSHSHEKDCCETHYLDFNNLSIDDFDGLIFDLSNDSFFTRIPDYGISLNPLNGFPVRIPGYGFNNGYYSSELVLILTDSSGEVLERYDISDCQVIEG